MVRFNTRQDQGQRRAVRMGHAVWGIRAIRRHRVVRSIGYRGALHNGDDFDLTRLAPRTGYARHMHRSTVESRKDRVLTRIALARVQPYAWPGGYLIVSYTSDGAMLCPWCAAVEHLRTFDNKIVASETIDYTEDGLEDDEPLVCEQCNRDMREL